MVQGSALGLAAGGVVSGFVATLEGIVGGRVVHFPVIGHVLVLAAVEVVLAEPVSHVVDLGFVIAPLWQINSFLLLTRLRQAERTP